MRNFSKLFVLFLFINLVGMTGCDKTAESVQPSYSILGTWNVTQHSEGHFSSSIWKFIGNNNLSVYEPKDNLLGTVKYTIQNNIFTVEDMSFKIIWKNKNELTLKCIDDDTLTIDLTRIEDD